MEELIFERYRELAVHIIQRQIIDYLGSKKITDYGFRRWLNNCTYIDYLGYDREWIYERVTEMKRNGEKLKGVHLYGDE